MNLKPRLILFCCGFFALASAPVFGAGEYEPARDGKTMIWNGSPKAGETGSWSGDRDKDNYASGFGDLAWSNANGKVFGLFYGNMVHGKFEGPVNVHTGGRVAHAYFVNGERVTAWARGAAKSIMTASEAAAVEKRKAETEKPAGKKENGQRAEAAGTPAAKKLESAKIAKTEATSSPAERPARGPDSYHQEAPEKSAKIAEKKNESASAENEVRHDKPLSAEEELKRTEPATNASRTFVESTPIPKAPPAEKTPAENVERPTPTLQPSIAESTQPSSLNPQPSAEITPPVLHESITQPSSAISERKSEVPEQSSVPESTQPPSLAPPPSSKETPADVSVNALVGPPHSLRTNSIPESSPPENKEPESASKPEGPLTESDAVDLADTEARAQGAPIDQYDRPKADHSAVKGKWTLFYSKKSDASSKLPAMFSATVEDKTKKVEIKK